MKFISPTSIAAVLIVVLSPAAKAQTNLLVNGSFEQPNVLTSASNPTDGWITYGNGYSVNGPSNGFNGWTVTSGEIDVKNAQRVGGSAAHGFQFLDIDGRVPGAVSQTFPVTPGKRYNLSFRYGQNSGASMVVRVTGASSASLFNKTMIAGGTAGTFPVGPWLLESGSFVANGTTATISFTSSSPSGSMGFKFDDVRITEAPLPYQNFAFNNKIFSGETIKADGASALHTLSLSVRPDGFITVTNGRRYDVGPTNHSPNPATGTAVSLRPNVASRLGAPITTSTNIGGVYTNSIQLSNGVITNMVFTNWMVSMWCPAALYLSDGSVFKGTASFDVTYDQLYNYELNRKVTNVYTNRSIWGLMTYSNGFGQAGLQN